MDSRSRDWKDKEREIKIWSPLGRPPWPKAFFFLLLLFFLFLSSLLFYGSHPSLFLCLPFLLPPNRFSTQFGPYIIAPTTLTNSFMCPLYSGHQPACLCDGPGLYWLAFSISFVLGWTRCIVKKPSPIVSQLFSGQVPSWCWVVVGFLCDVSFFVIPDLDGPHHKGVFFAMAISS